MRNRQFWLVIKSITVALCLLTFSPLVISPGSFLPSVLGMPYTLGLGIIISVLLILLVVLGALSAPEVDVNQEDAA